jgi:aminopeptidase N
MFFRASALSVLTLSAALAAAQLPEHAREKHQYDLVDVTWNLSFAFQQAAIKGDVVNTIIPDRDGATVLFDCRKLNVDHVMVDGKAATFQSNGKVLEIDPPSPYKKGTSTAIHIFYSGLPESGIYFVPSDRSFPAHTEIVYSQGEMEDNRYWLPTYDYPDDKATFDGTIHVPKGWKAVSNGKLVDVQHGATEDVWHWKLDKPNSTYLISLVAGPYDDIMDGTDPVPVGYWVPPGLDDWGKAAFGNTAAVVRFYSKLVGYNYPWPKYTQAAVADFMFGGMENVSCTTQTIQALFPPSTAPVNDATGLVAHELAHQWFGDLVTTRDWSHVWLNEGWATFLPNFWDREKYGIERYDLDRLGVFEGGLSAHRGNTTRSVVWTGYHEPIEMFDNFIYPGGASRMFMLMHQVGEPAFWPAISAYLRQNQYKNATTEIFFDSVSKSLGVNLDEFRKQWFYTPAAPSLTAKKDDDGIYIQQGATPFHLPLDYWLIGTDGSIVKKHVDLPATERYNIPDSRGKIVMLDPEVWLMADISYDIGYTAADVEKLYSIAPNSAEKARLIESQFQVLSLSEKVSIARSEKSTQLLSRILPMTLDRDLLLDMSHSTDGSVMVTAARSLGALLRSGDKSKAVTDRLQQLMDSNPNQDIQEAAFEALLGNATTDELAAKGLGMDSYNEEYRTASLQWYAEHQPDQARTLALEALKAITTSEPMRLTSIRILGRLKDKQGERVVYNTLASYMTERSNSPLRAAIQALADYGDKTAIPLLETRANHGLHFVRGDVKRAIDELRSK